MTTLPIREKLLTLFSRFVTREAAIYQDMLNITSPDNDLTILEPSIKSGILKFGEITDIPIMVKLSETVSSGSFISVSSTLDCSPYLINKDFHFQGWKDKGEF